MAVAARRVLRLDDLVASVFAKSNRKAIPSSQAKLQKFFYDARDNASLSPDVREALARLHFGAGDLFPFSRELEASLVRLQIGGLLSAPNPDYDKFTMSSVQKELVRARMRRLPEDDKKSIGALAEEFKKL